VTLLADVGYNTNDLEACCRLDEDDERENKQSATWGGVVSIELNY
jgi:hypothetical protein